jgi:hypothetical protein
MNRMWKEPLLLVLLGLASIGVVLSIRQLSLPPSNGSPSLRVEGDNAVLRRQVEESKDNIGRLEGRLKEAEMKLRDLETPSDNVGRVETRVPEHDKGLAPMAEGRMSYQEALARAWEYLQVGSFDSAIHKEILLSLDEAYAEKGLPPEANSSLVSTMARMNDLGVSAIIGEAKELPPKEASELLQTFLDTTPKLSERQKSRIKVALRKQSPSDI